MKSPSEEYLPTNTDTESPPTPAPAGALSFECLYCKHSWTGKKRPKTCHACGQVRFWVPPPKHAPTVPPIFYDQGSGNYYLGIKRDNFIKTDLKSVNLHLKAAGVESLQGVGCLTAAEHILWTAQTERAVDYAGPLSGYPAGPVSFPNGMRVLVTQSAKTPTAEKVDWEWLKERIFEITDGDAKQSDTFYAWLAIARQTQMRGDFRPGHFLVLSGEASCGKSFMQTMVTHLLGGRVGKPFSYMVGKTDFTGDLVGKEHLQIDDEATSTGHAARKAFAASIKQMTVSADFRIHPKNKEAVFIPTFRRNTASCNKDVSSLAFVPPLDDGLRDKVCLLQCGTAALSEDRDLNITKLKEGIPGLCYYLDRFKIPKRMTVRGWCPCPLCITESETPAKRFGFMAYHNPELVETIMSISPDEMLWGILTQVLWKSGDADKEQIGTAEEIEQLVDGTSFKQAKDRLLTFPGAFSTFLGLLASNRKGRVVKLSTRGRVRWVLTRPVY